MISAARAPVYPEAPATSTRAAGVPSRGCGLRSLTQRSPDLLQLRLDRLAALGDLLVGEGSIAGAELEVEREALAPLAELLALVEIEDLSRAQQPAAAGHHRRPHLGSRRLGRQHDREILVDGGESGDVLVALLADAGGAEQWRQVEFEGDGGVEVPAATGQRVHLAEPAGGGAAGRDDSRAARVQERLLCRSEAELDVELRRQTFEHAL